ncbi:TPA: hypothetical protein ACH3X1_007809 [Trebouxia sp. C0004]
MNPGPTADQTNKILQECIGYRRSSDSAFHRALIHPVIGALEWALANSAPRQVVKLLQPCPSGEAEFVLVKLLDGRQRLLKVHRLSLAHKLLLHTTWGRGSSSSLHSDKGRELRGFKLFLRAYIYAPEQATFVPVPDMPRHLPRQIRKALHDLHQIDTAGISSADLTALCVQDNNE